MDEFPWRTFLAEFSQALLQDQRLAATLPPNVIASDWLGFEGASEDEIHQLEIRLGIRLPNSYRQFLATTNGCAQRAISLMRVFSVSKVEWFRTNNLQWIDAYLEPARGEPPLPLEEHLSYGPLQDSCKFRLEYLQSALQISEPGDAAVLLLNPEITTSEGEWEAWFFANWYPGAVRFRSFWELMQHQRDSFQDLYERDQRRLQSGDDSETILRKVSGLLEDLEAKAANWRRGVEHGRAAAKLQLVQYDEAIIEALRFAKQRVHELLDTRMPTGELLAALGSLATRLETQHLDIHRASLSSCCHDPSAGYGEGLRESAAIINYFLRDGARS